MKYTIDPTMTYLQRSSSLYEEYLTAANCWEKAGIFPALLSQVVTRRFFLLFLSYIG